MDIAKSRNFLLTENIDKPLEEMAKITGGLKDAIDAVITANPDSNGLPLKKLIRADQTVLNALDGEDLYDNQLNKYIAAAKGEREIGQRGRKSTTDKPIVTSQDDEIEDDEVVDQTQTLSSEDDDVDPLDTWNVLDDEDALISDKEPKMSDLDKSFDKEVVTSPVANSYKNIITKKVSKIENAEDDETYKREMAALKQFIQKPEVKKSIGVDLIKNLVSPIMG